MNDSIHIFYINFDLIIHISWIFFSFDNTKCYINTFASAFTAGG